MELVNFSIRAKESKLRPSNDPEIAKVITVETKFFVGDDVWFMRDNKVTKGYIESVDMKVDETQNGFLCSISYYVNTLRDKGFSDCKWVGDNSLYATKEDLINSL